MQPNSACAVLAALFIASTSMSAAHAASAWDLNGSQMHLSANGAQREIRYYTVRPGLEEAGVQPGTLWFQGTRSGDEYSGTAYVFSKACGAIPYSVTGLLSADGQTITVHGSAPIVAGEGCAITDHRETDDSLHLLQNKEQVQAPRESKTYGDDGRIFSSGGDDYFLLARTPTHDDAAIGYVGQVRVFHHFAGGGYEILLKDYDVRCNAEENGAAVIWFKSGDHSTPVTVSIKQPNKAPKQEVKESYNLFWAACFEKFRKFK